MSRLSVDIDVVYLPWATPRNEALEAINAELSKVAARIETFGAQTRPIPSRDLSDTKLIADNGICQVKIEVNAVFMGTVLPVEHHPLSRTASDLFGIEIEAPILSREELYAGKIVAALDRQHPRDLFDIWRLYESEVFVLPGSIDPLQTLLTH